MVMVFSMDFSIETTQNQACIVHSIYRRVSYSFYKRLFFLEFPDVLVSLCT